ncbi:hypothetical protein ANO11243_034440 [Dothideomycetidae sp. 11243]|nr:hypothetical protein ANO11243_034440 [fungal sp. No.11243]
MTKHCRRSWAFAGALASACAEEAKDYGELVGTAYSARDMMAIVDGLGEDGLLRYWGISYGTILGMTAAAMFPDKIDRMVVDGVVNPHDYYAGIGTSMLKDSDAVFDGFLTGCMSASLELCPLQKWGLGELSLSQVVLQLLDTIKYQPVVTGVASQPVIDYDFIKPLILDALKSPASWQGLAFALDGLLGGNLTEAALGAAIWNTAASEGTDPRFPSAAGAENLPGIQCSDTAMRFQDLAEMDAIAQSLYAKTALVGDVLAASWPVTCPQWPFVAKERVQTDWNVKTRSPIMFIGNVYDPVTPLASARNASAGFEGSAVLVQNGYGHASIAQPSLCTAKYIRAYFVNGTLPFPDTICQVDVDTFADPTSIEYFEPLSNLTAKRGMTAQPSDDERLLAGLKSLSLRWSSLKSSA